MERQIPFWRWNPIQSGYWRGCNPWLRALELTQKHSVFTGTQPLMEGSV